MITDPTIRGMYVPWPNNWKFRKPSSNPEVREVEWATAGELAEQDVWRERLDALKQLNLTSKAYDRMLEYGIDALFERMDAEGAKYPPTWEDRKKWVERRGQQWHWSDCPNHQKLKNVQDAEMQSALDWLLEISQQKERIKAYVVFAGILRIDPGAEETYLAFGFWKVSQICETLSLEMPDPSEAP